jgi:hypothetical protein
VPTPRSKRKQNNAIMYHRGRALSQQQLGIPPSSSSSHSNYLGDIHSTLETLHNVSQDSGLSPSPLDLHHRHHHHAQDVQQVVRRQSAPYMGYGTPPPPLPPKKKSATPPTNVFQPTMLVKTPAAQSYGNYYNADQGVPTLKDHQLAYNNNGYYRSTQDYVPRPASSGIQSNTSSIDTNGLKAAWRQQQRYRVEAQRNSLLFSSDDDEDFKNGLVLRRSQTSLNGYGDFSTDLQLQQQRQAEALHRMSAIELSQTMNEPFPPELDFSQVVQNTEFNSNMPPPPPPRDPRRKLYLSSPSQTTRPMSYSFEAGNRSPDKPDIVPTPQQVRPLYASQQRILAQPPLRSRQVIRDTPRQGRAASASSYFRGLLPDFRSVPDLVSHHHHVKESPLEYWKSPPPPFAPSFDPNLGDDSSQCSTLLIDAEIPPPRPPRPSLRKKLSNTSSEGRPGGRDSAIGPSPVHTGHTGISSPSSSSVTSRDSGCSDQLQPLPAASGRPLSALIEAQHDIDDDDDDDDEEVELIHCESTTESSTTQMSPPRTDESHPGFSSKARRSLFRAALHELEDVFSAVEADADLLDRAERRDLPTAHQELIAQSRCNDDNNAGTSLNTSTEMLFSDMDNFMNWNTSSSFENISQSGKRQRTPSVRRLENKPYYYYYYYYYSRICFADFR